MWLVTEPSARTRGLRGDIQGLRAIAVTAVLAFHAGVPLVSSGYVGVDIFFVISGFLISSHLLAELDARGTIRLGAFYARRARRILPAALVVLAISIVGSLLLYPPLLAPGRSAIATALYLPNVLFAFQGVDYLAEETPSLFQHYWSLGIEEQFYLVWPVLLLLASRWLRGPRRILAYVAVLVALSYAACFVMMGRSQPFAFFLLPTRAWELGAGCLVAVLVRYRLVTIGPRVAVALGWLALVGVLASTVVFDESTPFPGTAALLPVVSTALLILAGQHWHAAGPELVLAPRPVAFIGEISYSLYLVHWPMLMLTQAAVGFENPLPLRTTIALALLSVPVAYVLHRTVEQPLRFPRRGRAERHGRVLVAAVAGTLACVALAQLSIIVTNTRTLAVEQSAAAPQLARHPTGSAYVPANLDPSLRGARADIPELYASGCHLSFERSEPADCVFGDKDAPRIVIFGDSHAAQWFPAVLGFAERNGYAVQTHTKSSCPSLTADIRLDNVPYTACTTWIDSVISQLNADRPALVLVSNYGNPQTPQARDEGLWRAGLAATLRRIEAPTAVIADTPRFDSSPANCLSAHVDEAVECAGSRDEVLSGPARRADRQAAKAADVPLLDLTEWLCGTRECPVVIGNLLVYRDAHHLTATFSRHLAAPLGTSIRALLADA